jgi:hypothetical protein
MSGPISPKLEPIDELIPNDTKEVSNALVPLPPKEKQKKPNNGWTAEQEDLLANWADIAACQATRFPPALVSALEKSVQSRGDVSVGVADALCFVLPVEAESDTNRVRKVSNVVLARPLVLEIFPFYCSQLQPA